MPKTSLPATLRRKLAAPMSEEKQSLDFMNLLRSAEELLYELVSWLLFYPLTFWRCCRHPIKMMAYAEAELRDNPQEQYADALSPPIFLFLTLLIAHLIGLRFGSETTVVLPGIFADDRNLLLFRAVLFSLFPLLLAIQRVRQRGQALTRETLRRPFYSQCYVAAPFIFALDLGLIVGRYGTPAAWTTGGAIFIIGLCWYISVLTKWFGMHTSVGRTRAFLRALATVLLAGLVLFAALVVIGLMIISA